MTQRLAEFADTQILVTGGAGAIGSNLVSRLCERDDVEIIVLDDLSSGNEWLLPDADNVTFIKGSILDDELLQRAFKHDLDYVFHLAAHFANKNSVDHPQTDLRINGMGTLKLLQYAQLTNPERFVYASSGCGVYGGDAKIPYDESDITIRHDTPYQVTKQLGEMYTYYFHRMYGLPIANARFFNSFGPGEVPGRYRNVIPNFMYWARNGESLPITGDGTESRDWTFVGDIIDGLLAMATTEDAIGEAFNLASGTETQVIEMAEQIKQLTDNDADIEYFERRDWDNKAHIVGDNDKTRQILGVEFETSFRKGLEEVSVWFDDNWDQIKTNAEF
jgi:nucleoside-diphosphate-sugar epimerase